MPLADVFSGDAFNMMSLTNSMLHLPYKPSRIGEMGLFTNQGVNTTTVVLEERDGVLKLLATKPRGAPAAAHDHAKRKARSFVVPHIPYDDVVLAAAIQDVRAWGSETRLQVIAGIINDRLQDMRLDHEVTLEHLRAGCISGNILDADGSTVIFNLFTEFSISQTEVDFDTGTAATEQSLKCLEVVRAIEDAIGNAPMDHVHALCSKNFFNAFITHATVKDAYARWRNGEFLRSDPRKGFEFAGIVFEEYRGSVGGVDFITAGDARFFPVGVPNLFKTYFAPADFFETVNTVGQPVYAKQELMDMDRGVKLHTQSNPLPMCHRPSALVRGHSTT